ncbi:S41 family peptidase [Aureitalea marina]|uniref:Peptidase S41 n=1 Tax=Aureitalea marina TaxID=930804 RepID=A0A2S7KPL9_9FLAO|nr:S41 family peptidase [Aureitalea marina]PQB04576.1 peptidase S41 [Aureitalea marina]
MTKPKLLLLLFLVSLISTSCFDDLDDNPREASTLDIQNFIWRGLNFFYLYKDTNPNLANNAFASQGELDAFLSEFETPEELFGNLKFTDDRFSILVDDYIELENSLGGITLNNGMEFGLILYPDESGDVFGYVRYVLPNSDAAVKGVVRGMIFNTVNGVQIDDQNFNQLFTPESYTIGLATFDGENVEPTGESIELIKSVIAENPIFISKTFDIAGRKIGYLMYNGFTNEYDSELNAVFAQFAGEGITDLVLDLRYNSGGSVRTARYLSSMITGQFTGQVIYQEEWNADRQEEYAENGLFVNSFINGGESINSLNLDQVYVLATRRTASSSELVINGLTPYIDVVQIGENTTGKYQASFLLYDAPAPNFSRSQANPDHTYAMLPLVFKLVNADGFTDFDDGLIPDINFPEDYTNLGILGQEDEPLLARAIEEITGVPAPGDRRVVRSLETISESKSSSPAYQVMWDLPRQ